MLYFDSSALVKKYVREAGTDAVWAKFHSSDRVFVSQIAFAECLSAFTRKFKHREIDASGFQHACDAFVGDWTRFLRRVEVDAKTMTYVRDLVMHLRASDAIQLSTAMWLNDASHAAPETLGYEETLEFVATDENLLTIALLKGLRVYNPTATP